MDQLDWPGKQWRAEHQACRCPCLTATLLRVIFLFQNTCITL